ncbi:hypothetical protein [Actinoplanes sp. URMC 104]|uniref:hypothetical protein n=1 Tax=Actinoplanes sp. URMC 104 TaxID=3423409 RepID=UPI003F19A4D7
MREREDRHRPARGSRLVRALVLDLRHLPVLLGYVTAEEMGVPAQPPRVHRTIVDEVVMLLEGVPWAVAREYLAFLQFRIAQTRHD